LVDDYPILVITLSARNRTLFGSVPYIDPLPFFVIGFLRILAAGITLFFVGRWFGERALRWTESQVGEMPRIYKWTEAATVRAGWLAVVLMPASNIVCLLVGHLRMAPLKFLSLITTGIVIRLIVLWYGGKIFEDQIRAALDWIDQYQWWVVGILFGLTFFQTSRRKSPGAPQP
jgi:membrane protein DedA with SNARE-associated domain